MIKPFGLNTILVDRLGTIDGVKIANGKLKFTMPARSGGVFTVEQ
jgi:hypothetical protein